MSNEIFVLASEAEEARSWLPPKILSICIELNCAHCEVSVMLARLHLSNIRMEAEGTGRPIVVLCGNCSAMVVASRRFDEILLHKKDDPDFVKLVSKYRAEMN